MPSLSLIVSAKNTILAGHTVYNPKFPILA